MELHYGLVSCLIKMGAANVQVLEISSGQHGHEIVLQQPRSIGGDRAFPEPPLYYHLDDARKAWIDRWLPASDRYRWVKRPHEIERFFQRREIRFVVNALLDLYQA